MTSPGGGGAGGINLTTLWVNVAPSMAGMTQNMSAGGAQAANAFGAAFKKGFDASMSGIFSAWHASVKGAVEGIEGLLGDMFSGRNVRPPELGDLTPYFQGIEGMIGSVTEKFVGLIPLVGPVFAKVTAEFTESFQEITGLAGEVANVLQEIGTQWQEVGREIEGATGASEEQLKNYLNVTAQILASGDIVHLEDVAGAIGVIGDRVANINNEQLREFTTLVAMSEELIGRVNVQRLTGALSEWGISAEDVSGKYQGLINIVQDSKMPMDTLTNQLIQLGPVLKDFGLNLDQTATFLGLLNKQQIDPSRFAYTFQRAVRQMTENGQEVKGTLTTILQEADNLLAVGNKVGARSLLENLFGPYGAEKMLDVVITQGQSLITLFGDVNKNISDTPERTKEAVEATATLGDQMEAIRNRITSDFKEMGLGLADELKEAGANLSGWFEEHKGEVIGWGQDIFNSMVSVTSGLINVTADGLTIIAPLAEIIKNVVADVGQAVAGIMSTTAAFISSIPNTGLFAPLRALGFDDDTKRAFGDIAGQAMSLIKPLDDLKHLNLRDTLRGWATDGRVFANETLPHIQEQINAAVDPTKNFALATEDLRQHMVAMPDDKTISFKGEGIPEMEAGLKKVGIAFEKDSHGMVTKIHAANEQTKDDFEAWYKEVTGKEIKIPIELVDEEGNEVKDTHDALKPGEPVQVPIQPIGTGEPTQGPKVPQTLSQPGMPAPASMSSGAVPLVQRPDGTWTSPNPAWAHLIERESGGNPTVPNLTDSNAQAGDPSKGLFQFTTATWLRAGGGKYAPSPDLATPQQQAEIAANLLRMNPSGSDWGAGIPGRENAQELLAGLGVGPGTATTPGTVPAPGTRGLPMPSITLPSGAPLQMPPGFAPPATMPPVTAQAPGALAGPGEMAVVDQHGNLLGKVPINRPYATVLKDQQGNVIANIPPSTPPEAPAAEKGEPPPIPTPVPFKKAEWREYQGWHYYVSEHKEVYWVPPDTKKMPPVPEHGTPVDLTDGYWRHTEASDGSSVLVWSEGPVGAARPAHPPTPPATPTGNVPQLAPRRGGPTTPSGLVGGGAAGPPTPGGGAVQGPGLTASAKAWAAQATGAAGVANLFSQLEGAARGGAPAPAPSPLSGEVAGMTRYNALSAQDQAFVKGIAERMAANGGRFANADDELLWTKIMYSDKANAAFDAAARVAGGTGATVEAGSEAAESILGRTGSLLGKAGSKIAGPAGVILPFVTETIWPGAHTAADDTLPVSLSQLDSMSPDVRKRTLDQLPPDVRQRLLAMAAADGYPWATGYQTGGAVADPFSPSGGATWNPNSQDAIIQRALAASGIPKGDWPRWTAAFKVLTSRESGNNVIGQWDPTAVNNYDVNAAAGNASVGVAQVTPGTAAMFGIKGDLRDPYTNLLASIAWIKHKYGDIGKVQQANPNLPPRGYQGGGGAFHEGHVPYLGPTGRDSVHALLEPGEFVVKRDIAMKHMNDLWLLNAGAKGFQPGGPVGQGSADYAASGRANDDQGVSAEILGAEKIANSLGLTLTAGKSGHGTHEIDKGYHDSGSAGDFSNGVDTIEEAQFAMFMAQNYGAEIAELIHYGKNWDANYNIKDGKFIRDYGGVGTVYDDSTLEGHRDHVHIAFKPGASPELSQGISPGTATLSGPTAGAPGTTLAGSPDQVAGSQYLAGLGLPTGTGPTNALNTGGQGGWVSSPTTGRQVFLGPKEYAEYQQHERDRARGITEAQTGIGEAQRTITEDTQKQTDAMSEYNDKLAEYNAYIDQMKQATGGAWKVGDPVPPGFDKDEFDKLSDAVSGAAGKYDSATRGLQNATDSLGKKTDAYRDLISKPAEEPKGEPITPEKNAQQLGKGLISGLLQGLGFDSSVFSNPLDWGLYKLFTGTVNYGMGMINKVQEQGSPLLGTAQGGGPQGPQASEPGSGMVGLLNSFMPGIDQIIQPTVTNMPAEMSAPGEGPTGPGGPGGPPQQTNIFNGVPIDGAINDINNSNLNGSRGNVYSTNPTPIPVGAG